MERKETRTIHVLAIDAHCHECGWIAQPVLLAYNQVSHSEALWCQTCFAQANETGHFNPTKEVPS